MSMTSLGRCACGPEPNHHAPIDCRTASNCGPAPRRVPCPPHRARSGDDWQWLGPRPGSVDDSRATVHTCGSRAPWSGAAVLTACGRVFYPVRGRHAMKVQGRWGAESILHRAEVSREQRCDGSRVFADQDA
jgi:hypothetical protein